MADRKISDLTALTTPASGDYLPIVDISEVAAASKNKRITIEELMRGAPDGTAAAPSIAFESDPNTGIYSPGADQLAVSTGGTGRLFVDSSGNVGIGTSSPTFVSGGGLTIYKVGDARITLKNNTTGDGSSTGAGLVYSGVNLTVNNQEAGFTAFTTTGTERLRIDSSGRVGIGTSSPIGKLDVTGSNVPLIVQSTVAASNYITHRHVTSGDIAYIGNGGGGALTAGTTSDYVIRANLGSLIFACNGDNERARIDSSGRLLVGTSTSVGVDAKLQTVDDSNANPLELIASPNNDQGPNFNTAKARGSTASPTVVSSGDILGRWRFRGYDGSAYQIGAEIAVQVDGTPGANDMPGRLVFSTTADGAASPTERMRIASDGFTNLFVTANDGFQSRNSAAAGTTYGFFVGRHSAANTGDGTISYVVYTNGNVQNTNNSYGAISDAKLKENIVDANSQWDDLKALQVRNYNFKEGQTHTQIGLVAQEVELVSPGLVSESPDRDGEGSDLGTVTKSVNYSVLYMKAVKALQEAMERIEALEADVAQLKGA